MLSSQQMKLDAAIAVTTGAGVLDEQYPGWAEVIDLDKFDVGNPYHCVLGQVVRHYHGEEANYLRALRYVQTDAVPSALGFDDWFDSDNPQSYGKAFPYLKSAWVIAVNTRRQP